MTGVVGHEGSRGDELVVGVDTHQDEHVAAVIDRQGVRLGELHTVATIKGYGELERWSRSLGEIQAFGIEGTGSYGAGVARFLTRRGYIVVEVNRPDRSTRYRKGKSDPTDAEMAARAVLAVELEDTVAIAVDGQGDPIAAYDSLHQQEVAPGVLLRSEESIGHRPGGIVHRQQQDESGSSILQPAVMAAVDLQQHALLGHPFPSDPVLGRTMLPGAGQAMAVEKAAYRLTAQVNTLPIRQHFGEVAVIESGVLLAGQNHRGGSDILGDRIAGLAAPVAVDQCGGPVPPVGR